MGVLEDKLGLKFPLIVAPMAGGPSSVELVAASSNAGALGSMGAAYSTPTAMREFVANLRGRTSKPFAMNLFIPTPLADITDARRRRALEVTDGYRQEFGISQATLAPPYAEDFEAQFETVIDLKPSVLSYVFGLLSPAHIERARRHNILTVGTAASVDEAVALEASGCEAIVLQGVEAGGHRAIFDATAEDPSVGTMDLLGQTKARVKLPLIAAGGLMNAKQVREALASGASAVQLGTAFLTCQEAGTSAPYRRALLSGARSTKITRVFSGRFARGLKNRFMTEVEALGADAILPFPAQNKLTRDLRAASVKADSPDFLSLWAGTGEGELWRGSAAQLIESLF